MQSPGQAQIEFLGRVSDGQRDELLSKARALLFPGEEDFGIVPVEAQAAGVPVIAYGVGGATESVLDGHNGVLFGEQSAAGLGEAIGRFERVSLDDAKPWTMERGASRSAMTRATARSGSDRLGISSPGGQKASPPPRRAWQPTFGSAVRSNF